MREETPVGWYYDYKPYVPVAQRRAQAAREVAKLKQKGRTIIPVVIEGRTIASTFWGKAWCANLESYGDFANRLPRGRTYVRNGSVVNLTIEKGRIEALVSGSELYEIEIEIAPAPEARWLALKQQSAGQIGSLVELLQGKLSKGVMELMTQRDNGLFPAPDEITMRCSCPDYAGMCKHLAAVLYGVGNRLDSSPDLLFLLRGVDHMELIEEAIPAAPQDGATGAPTIAMEDLGDIFGIEVDDATVASASASATTSPKNAAKKPSKKAAGAKTNKKPAAKAASKKAATVATGEKPASKAVSKKTAAVGAKEPKKAQARKKI